METVLNLREVKPVALDDLFHITYTQEDVFVREEDKRARMVELNKAVTLGKSTKIRTYLVFGTTTGFRRIKCVVRGVNAKGVTVEHGHVIPVHAVYGIDLA